MVRAEGELNTIDAIEEVVLSSAANQGNAGFGRVLVKDVAQVGFGYSRPRARIRNLGEPAIAVNTVRETGANVIETMEGIRLAVSELEKAQLEPAGLYITQVYDETIYINGAIELVIQNIWIGGALGRIHIDAVFALTARHAGRFVGNPCVGGCVFCGDGCPWKNS